MGDGEYEVRLRFGGEKETGKDGGDKGEEKGMDFGVSDSNSDGLGGTERNDCADVNEWDSAIGTAMKGAHFQTSKIKYKLKGTRGHFWPRGTF